MARKRKVALVMGAKKSHLKVDIDGDGRSVEDWVHQNAQKAGMSDQAWLNQLGDNINQSAWADQEGQVPQLNSPDDLRGVLDGLYDEHAGDYHGGSDQIWSMFKAGGAKFDSSWQYRTNAERDTGKTEQRRVYDFSKKSWVVKEMKVKEYLNPANPYLVGNYPVGSIVLLTNDKTGQTACMAVGDTGTNKAEMSPGAANAVGIPINGSEIPTTDTTATLTYLGMGSSRFPTTESVQADCERLQAEYQKKLDDEKKKAEEEKAKKGKKKQKHASAQEQGGAFYLAQVEDHGVHAGKDQLLVAVAHPSCLHSGGQPVCTGSGSIVVGRSQAPLAGEGDETRDGFVIRDRTGDQTIDMT